MPEIQGSKIERAEKELRSIAERRAFKNRDIDWRLIKNQLSRLNEALLHDDRKVFNEALEILRSRLSPPNILRAQINFEDQAQVMPPAILELVNHIVDKLHYRLTETTDSKHERGEESQADPNAGTSAERAK